GGPRASLNPDVGLFDRGSERFTFLLPSRGLGNHLLEFQAPNSSGRNMLIPASALVTVAAGAAPIGASGTDDADIHPRLHAGPVPSSGGVRFSLAGRRGSSARARL